MLDLSWNLSLNPVRHFDVRGAAYNEDLLTATRQNIDLQQK